MTSTDTVAFAGSCEGAAVVDFARDDFADRAR